MTSSIKIINSSGEPALLYARPLTSGTPIHPGNPRVVLVLKSEQGAYLGHMETTPENAHILSELVRQAAEAAAKQEEK